MTFNSFYYFLFLPVVYLVFYTTHDRWRWLVLLIASYGFYASFNAPYLLAVLLITTGTSYICAHRIAKEQDETIRKRWLWFGSVICVALLAALKYAPFLESYGNSIFGLNSTSTSTLISIGISYFTFQAISYVVDVFLDIQDPEPHFGRYALYMAFFPKLLQGPIERAGDLLPQLRQPYRFDYDAMRSGLLLFTFGLFKKVVLADRLALYADQVYNNVHSYTGLSLLVGTYAYAMQIYFDFSAYTDMARGTAQLFGIELTKNFNAPYLATSIADFWRRWHISFSRWILDYIFKPLQLEWRNRGQHGTSLALLVTFFVSGIWHGASWGFVVGGGLHGIYLASSTYYRPHQKRLHKWMGVEKSKWLKFWQIFVTFNLVTFAWVFFRADSLRDAVYVISHLLDFDANYSYANVVGVSAFLKKHLLLELGKGEFVKLFLLGFTTLVLFNCRHIQLSSQRLIFRWATYYSLILGILLLGVTAKSKFIYFKF